MNVSRGLIATVGRRGACLIVLGFLQFVFGWSFWSAPRSILTIFQYIPHWVAGLVWIIPGCVSFASIRRSSQDVWGFVGGWLVPFLWGSFYFFEIIPPLNQLPLWSGIRVVAFLWGYAALVLVISGWPESQIDISEEGSSDDGNLGGRT